MGMYFNTGVEISNILFKNWNTTDVKGAIIAAAITLVVTLLFEALTTLQTSVSTSRKMNPITNAAVAHQHHQVTSNGGEVDSRQRAGQINRSTVDLTESSTDLLSSLQIPASISLVRRRKLLLFSLESFLHMFRFLYAYILMLLVMTYSVWFVGPVLVGSGVGYFIFQPIRQKISSRLDPPQPHRPRDRRLDDLSTSHADESTGLLQSQQSSYSALET